MRSSAFFDHSATQAVTGMLITRYAARKLALTDSVSNSVAVPENVPCTRKLPCSTDQSGNGTTPSPYGPRYWIAKVTRQNTASTVAAAAKAISEARAHD